MFFFNGVECVGVGEKERKKGEGDLCFEISLRCNGGFQVSVNTCCDDGGWELGGSWDWALTGVLGWGGRVSARAGSGGTLTVLAGF